MATIDMTNPVDRVRLVCGDMGDIPMLTDDVYSYYITKYNGNENRAVRDCAYAILGILSGGTRERLDRLEVFNNLTFTQYLQFLKEIIKDPRTAISIAGGYAGGLSIADWNANDENPDVIPAPDMPVAITFYPLSF